MACVEPDVRAPAVPGELPPLASLHDRTGTAIARHVAIGRAIVAEMLNIAGDAKHHAVTVNFTGGIADLITEQCVRVLLRDLLQLGYDARIDAANARLLHISWAPAADR